VALPLILGTGLPHAGPRFDHNGDAHGHDHLAADGFETVSFATKEAFCAERFQAFLENLPTNVFRAKGVLTIDCSDRRHLFHLVGRRFTLDEAPAGLTGHSRLVLIGRNLDADGLRAQLAACLVPSLTPGLG
jgi:G3E family GTPase